MNEIITVTFSQSEIITFFDFYLINYLVFPIWSIACAMSFILGVSTGSR